MTERDEVLSILKRESHGLKYRFGVVKVGVFDSVLRNEPGDSSDLDLLIELDPESVTYKNILIWKYISSHCSQERLKL